MVEYRVYAATALSDIPSEVCWMALIVSFASVVFFLLWKGFRAGGLYISRLLLAEWLLLVLGITVFFRNPGSERKIDLLPLSSYFDIPENSYLKEVAAINILNVVLFVPVGFMLGCGFRKMTWKGILFFGCGVSVFIELLQLTFKRGLCETDDVIHNVIGCMIGFFVHCLLSKLLRSVQKIF